MNTPEERARRETPKSELDARLEAEIEAALGDTSLEDMLDMAERPRRGGGAPSGPQVKTGTIVRIHGDDVFVEFGPKSVGVCARMDFENPPTVGERMSFVVERFDSRDGLLILSREGAVRKAAWESLEVGQVVEARCTGVNKGGLDMEVAQHRAFMPAGQVDLRHIEDLSVFIGEKFPCEVVELDRLRGRIVLSRRRPLEADRARQREKVLEELQPGDTRQAVIRSIQPYGAFADLGGVDGLIHISDICHERLKHPSERVAEGETVQVRVLKIERGEDGPRISLGMKQCLADPYEAKASEIKAGDVVSGKVTRIMPFGAFVELAPGVEGLIHISQLSQERVTRVNQVVRPNEIVKVKVLDVDRERRRISLSLRAAVQQEEGAALRPDDPRLRKLRDRFGGNLRGGIG